MGGFISFTVIMNRQEKTMVFPCCWRHCTSLHFVCEKVDLSSL